MQVSARYGIIFLVTKYGFVHCYHLETGICINMPKRISVDNGDEEEEDDKFEEREEGGEEPVFEEREEEAIAEEREEEEDVTFSNCDICEMEEVEPEGYEPEITSIPHHNKGPRPVPTRRPFIETVHPTPTFTTPLPYDPALEQCEEIQTSPYQQAGMNDINDDIIPVEE